MPTNPSIRYRLLTIIALGVITSALSLIGLVRIISASQAQRLERARDAVSEEVDRISRRPEAISEPPPPRITSIGVRGGVLAPGESIEGVSEQWREPVTAVIAESKSSRQLAQRELSLEGGTLVTMAKQADDGRTVWAGYVAPLPSFLRIWQAIVVLLTIATSLLVATAIHSIVTVRRGAAGINRSLAALAQDLDAPIPRPSVRELAEIAEGVSRLAGSLARSRAKADELSKALGERERLAALGRVVAGVAHEVRNPLASIKLRLDLAAVTTEVPEAVSSAIAHASSEIARLDRLVDDLLVVAARAPGPRTRVSLGDLLRQRTEALAPIADTRGVTLAVEGEVDARVDVDALARAVDNLLHNAVEASPKGSEVTVSVEEAENGTAIRVIDRGNGVAPDRTRELFEPFFTTKAEGTGLGLALSRAIARAHGGDVVYRREDETSVFELTLGPDAEDRETGAPRRTSSPATSAKAAAP